MNYGGRKEIFHFVYFNVFWKWNSKIMFLQTRISDTAQNAHVTYKVTRARTISGVDKSSVITLTPQLICTRRYYFLLSSFTSNPLCLGHHHAPWSQGWQRERKVHRQSTPRKELDKQGEPEICQSNCQAVSLPLKWVSQVSLNVVTCNLKSWNWNFYQEKRESGQKRHHLKLFLKQI